MGAIKKGTFPETLYDAATNDKRGLFHTWLANSQDMGVVASLYMERRVKQGTSSTRATGGLKDHELMTKYQQNREKVDVLKVCRPVVLPRNMHPVT